MFGGKKDKDSQPSSSEVQPSLNSNVADSAYASSENEPRSKNSDVVPMENTGQIQGVSGDRRLGVNKSTGDVMDTDTGEVVSTVTTTTTTSTCKLRDINPFSLARRHLNSFDVCKWPRSKIVQSAIGRISRVGDNLELRASHLICSILWRDA